MYRNCGCPEEDIAPVATNRSPTQRQRGSGFSHGGGVRLPAASVVGLFGYLERDMVVCVHVYRSLLAVQSSILNYSFTLDFIGDFEGNPGYNRQFILPF